RPVKGLSAPFGLASAGYSNGVWLDWAPNGEAGLAGYNIYRSTSSSGPFTKHNSSLLGASAYVDTSVGTAITYFYRVFCVNAAGQQSGPAGVTGIKTPTPPPVPAASSPSSTPTPSNP